MRPANTSWKNGACAALTIQRLFHAERWRIGTIAAQLGVHHTTVRRVLAQQGVAAARTSSRPSIVDPFVPLIVETLAKYPRLTASRLCAMARARGYAGSEDHFRTVDLRVRRAGFEQPTTLEDFDFHFNPTIPRARVIDLATCAFVERRENVLLVGKTGVGKTHLAQAFGLRACRLGYDVLFVSAPDLFRQLRAARGDGTYERRLARLTGVDVLVVDDLGLRALSSEEAGDLYEVIRLRHKRGSLVITTNL